MQIEWGLNDEDLAGTRNLRDLSKKLNVWRPKLKLNQNCDTCRCVSFFDLSPRVIIHKDTDAARCRLRRHSLMQLVCDGQPYLSVSFS